MNKATMFWGCIILAVCLNKPILVGIAILIVLFA